MSKPMGPGVIRASTVLVWHVGQIGRRMGMMLSPLVQAGALQNSQSPVDTEGAMMNQLWNLRDPAADQFCSFSKS